MEVIRESRGVICDFYRKIKTTRNSSGIPMVKLSLQLEAVSVNFNAKLLIMFHDGDFSFLDVLFNLYTCFSKLVCFSVVVGKEFEGEKEFFSNGEWEERLDKWKARQEKRDLQNKEEGKDDQGEDDYL